jgi:hypothetical protein
MKFINHEIENGHSMIDVLIVEIRLTISTITLEKYRSWLIIASQTTLILLYIISRYEMYTVYMYDNTHIRESRL